MEINLIQIGVAVLYIISCIFIYKFWKMALFGKVPQGPASMGTGIAAISVLPGATLFVVWCIDEFLFSLLGVKLDLYLYLAIPIVLTSQFLGGYLATKTTEDTATMNLKLVLVLGAIPHFLVSVLAFFKLPSWIIQMDLIAYIPALILGRLVYLRRSKVSESGS